jgi:hypothetical protein
MLIDNCAWDNPGSNPYMGTMTDAIARYTEIPSADRAMLIKAINEKKYDDIVLITRDKIIGSTEYSPHITNMHFGMSTVCKNTSRKTWDKNRIERGLVFSTPNVTIMIPTVCRNVSIIHKAKPVEVTPVPPKVVHQVPEPWMFPAILAYAAYFTFKRKK